MRKVLVVVLAVMLIASVSYGAMVATRISGNTVSFSTVTGGWGVTPNVVTFNTTTTRVRLTNLSTLTDCYVDLRCVDTTGKSGYMTKDSCTLLVPAVGRISPNTVEIDFATRNIGFSGNRDQTSTDGGVSGSDQRINYTLIGDTGSF